MEYNSDNSLDWIDCEATPSENGQRVLAVVPGNEVLCLEKPALKCAMCSCSDSWKTSFLPNLTAPTAMGGTFGRAKDPPTNTFKAVTHWMPVCHRPPLTREERQGEQPSRLTRAYRWM